MRNARLFLLPLALTASLPLASCSEDLPVSKTDAGGADSGTPIAYPYESVEQKETFKGAGLSAPVDVVRDDMGVPHIFAMNLPDASYAQGYFMARDRWLEMDFARRQASGTLTEIVGALNDQAILSDINYRTHHMRRTAEATWKALQESPDADDKKIVASLTSFAAGVNAWQAGLAKADYKFPDQVALLYSQLSVAPWVPADSLLLGEMQAFQLAFNADSEVQRSKTALAEQTEFVGSADLERKKRAGFTDDYGLFAPFDATHTVNGWGEVTAALLPGLKPGKSLKSQPAQQRKAKNALALLDRASRSLQGVGLDKVNDPSRGSNNWVVGPSLSASGHAMVANDTHLSLSNPAVFYLNHLTTADGYDVEGVQFPGIPFVILGMNKQLAWGSTVNYIDVTDVYQEEVVDCAAGGGKCVKFKGAEVKLIEHAEAFKIGAHGEISDTKTFTFYEVPHHGPIIPNVVDKAVQPLKGSELSIKYTGYEPGRLLRAVYALNTAKNVDEGVKAVEDHFTHGGQNWVLGDAAGHIAWTQTIRVPKRPKGTKPWAVLPGDGSAEWQGYWDPKELPHAKDPSKGYLVTANADPVGVTDDNDPMNEPEVGGFPKYMGYDYDPGTRVGRITKRIVDDTAGGKKLDLNAMQSIQADAISDFGKFFAPTFLAAAKALDDEAKTPGTHPELAAMLAAASAPVKGYLQSAQDLVKAWTFDTPAAMPDESPTAAQIADSKASLIMAAWTGVLSRAVMGDELKILGAPVYRAQALKLLAQLLKDPTKLKTGTSLYDDLETPGIETKETVVAKSVIDALDFLFKAVNADANLWRWGNVHTVTMKFFASVGLDLPATPRHGGDGTVDVASHGVAGHDYTFKSGAAIRFVCELDPVKGPIARNVIPGGQIFDPKSPHYSDFFDLWKKNQTTDLAFQPADVVTRAKAELAKNKIGRVRFTP